MKKASKTAVATIGVGVAVMRLIASEKQVKAASAEFNKTPSVFTAFHVITSGIFLDEAVVNAIALAEGIL